MTSNLARRLSGLSVEERLELIDHLWQGIEDDDVHLTLSPKQEAELDARYEAFLRDPNTPRTTLKEIAAKLGVKL